MTLKIKKLFYKLLERSFQESHIESQIKFNILSTKKVSQDLKDAIKQNNSLGSFDSSDVTVFFELLSETPQDPRAPSQDNSTQAPETTQDNTDNSNNQNANTSEPPTENNTEDNSDNDEENKQNVQEEKEEDAFVLNNTDVDNVQVLQEKILKAIKRSLYIDETEKTDDGKQPEPLKLYNLDYKGKKCFYLPISMVK